MSAPEQNMDIISVQEPRYYYRKLQLKYHASNNKWIYVSASAWKTSFYTATEGVRILSPYASQSLNKIERIQLRMMYATFNSNSCITISLLLPMPVIKQILPTSITYSQIQSSDHQWRHGCSNRQRRKEILLTQVPKRYGNI